MKRFQKVLAVVLTAAMLLGLFAGFSVAYAAEPNYNGTCGTNVYYTYSGGHLYIYGNGRIADYIAGTAPWYSYATEVQSVTISEGVQHIGRSAFETFVRCSSYSIPNSVKGIGEYAFAYNSALTSIALPGVESVGGSAFMGCSALTSATYPSTASIAAGNDKLTQAANYGGSSTPSNPGIPSGSIYYESTSGSIKWSFYTNGALVISPAITGQSVHMASYANQSTPWASYIPNITSITISDGILTIGEYAFANMTAVTSVNIGQSTTSIGAYAFSGCTKLQQLTFTAHTRTVGDCAFQNCNSLSRVNTPLTINQMTISNVSYGNYPLMSAMIYGNGQGSGTTPGGSTYPSGSGSGQIPGTNISWNVSAGILTVTSSTGNEAIQSYSGTTAPWANYATQITTLNLSGITVIGSNAFAGMSALRTVNLGTSVTEIQAYAFQGAMSLQMISLPESLRIIRAYAFYGGAPIILSTPNRPVMMNVSTEGHSITMQYSSTPSGSGSTGGGNPSGGTGPNIGDITPSATSGSCGNGVWYSYNETTKKMTIYGSGYMAAYANAWDFPWFDFAGYIKEIEIQQGVKNISSRAFYFAGELVKITIPKSVESIEAYAFYASNNLSDVEIDNVKGAVSISDRGNDALVRKAVYTNNGYVPPVIEPEGPKYNGVIDNTSISWSFDIPSGELLIRSTSSAGERMLDYGTYNSNVGSSTLVAPWAHLAAAVKKITLQGITHVAAYAFSDMKNLTTVSLAGVTQSIGSYAFSRDTAITHLTFPAALTVIQHGAFYGCNSSTIATTPLTRETISVGANNDITIQYGVSGSTNVTEGFIQNTSILWSYDKNTKALTIQSTSGIQDIPDQTMGSAPWQSISSEVVSIKMRGIRSIGSYAFAYMTALQTVDFAAETTTIGLGAFMQASSLRSLTFGPQLTVIKAYAFNFCTVNATTPNVQSAITKETGNDGLIITYGQDSGLSNENNIPGTSIYWSYSNGVLTIRSISSYGEALDDYTNYAGIKPAPWSASRYNVTKVILSGITQIGQFAFADMTALKEVVYASNTESVGSYAFANCVSLKTQSLPKSLTKIYSNAFSGCSSLVTTTSNNKDEMMFAELGNSGLIWPWSNNPGGSGGTQSQTSGIVSGTSIYWNLDTTTGVLTLTATLSAGEAIPDSRTATYPWSESSLNQQVKKIVLQGITAIGDGAFTDLSELTDVSFGDKATSIGMLAFLKAKKLKTIVLPNSLTEIHSDAFLSCDNITAYTANAAVLNAAGVKNVFFIDSPSNPNPNPDPGTNPDPNPGTNPDTPPVGPATSGAIESTGISWIYLAATNQLTISSSAGEALPSFASADKAPWADWADEIVSVRLLNITSIGKYAFAEMPKLASVVFADDKLTTIDQYAFANAKALKALTLGAAVTKIEANAFAGCTLTIDTPNYQKDVTFSKEGNTGVTWNFKVRDYSAWTPIEDTELEWRVKDNVLYIYGDGSIPNFDSAADTPWAEIAADIEKISLRGEMSDIGTYAFAGMTKVTEIALPDSVKTIGASAFRGCTALETVSFPTSLTSIGDYAFSGCEKLGNLELPAALSSIGREAFYDCSSIVEIDFLTSKKLTIGSSAFAGCTALTKAVRLSSAELVIDAVGNETLDKALRPDSASGTTKEGITWNADCVNGILTLQGSGAITDGSAWTEYLPYINTVIITNTASGNGITEIGEALFKDATTIEMVSLPATLTKIGADAFAGCTALKTIDLPASLVEIGNRAFKNCSALTEVALPHNVTVLHTEVFAGCTSLKTVTTSYLLTTIGQGAFKDCTALEKFTIPATVTSLASEAFNGCSALTTLVVAKDGLKTIQNNTFVGCDALATVYFAGTEAEWTQMTANADAALKGAAYSKAITLTIEYYYKDTTTAAPTVVIVGAPGDVAQVVSPVIAHYSASHTVIDRKLSADETVTVLYNPESYWLTIYYKDAQGNDISDAKRVLLYYNEEFKSADASVLPVIKGYRADREIIDLGVITGEVEPITVTYELCEYTVNVVQVDQDGKLLSDKVYTFKGLYGSDIAIDMAQLDEIAHYELSDENVYTIKNISADITAEDPYKIVYQKKAYSLTIEFKDEDGFMVDPSKTITVFYGEPVNYEVPSLEEKGYIPLDSVLTLEAYNGEESLVARYKIKTFSLELQFVEVNSDGHKMLNSKTVDIVYGSNFIYEIPAIAGYVANQAKVDLGIVTTQPEGPIIIEYTPALYDMTIQLFDKDGKALGSQLVEDIQVGTTYKIALNPVEGYLTEGIVVEGTMGPDDNNKIVTIVLEKVPETEPDPVPGPGPGTDVEPDPKPDPEPEDNKFETIIVIVLVVVVLALAAMIFYVSYLKKRN